jgi:hypothetical protein
MNFDTITWHDLPTGALVVIGIVLLGLVFRTGKLVTRLVFVLIAAGLFAAAYWWQFQR